MPIFEFECKDCSNKFEEITKVHEKICCPQCKSSNLRKLISAVGTNSNDRKCNWGDTSLPNKQEFERIRSKTSE
ncbi:MAG: zinc ribbon domain-containing protein [Proteobacteria bacterium]|nr:zinc ribbon domain-containing protein [Pseudomonadota bacterium]MBU1640616.1 zinc ribbon domain-containing protein [Pseudomonadota bacterium]